MTNKLSDKDKKDWEKFVKGHGKIENKDKDYSKNNKKFLKKTIDLHGYTLEEANKKITELPERVTTTTYLILMLFETLVKS